MTGNTENIEEADFETGRQIIRRVEALGPCHATWAFPFAALQPR